MSVSFNRIRISFNYLFLTLVILWKPLHSTIILLDGKGRLLVLFTIMTILLNMLDKSFQRFLFSKPIILWLLWCVYSSCNSYVKGLNSEYSTLQFYIIINYLMPCIVMTISSCLYVNNTVRFLKFSMNLFIVYLVVGLFLSQGVSQSGRLDTSIGNLLPLNSIILLFVIFLNYNKSKISNTHIYLLMILILYILLASASRKAFIAFLIILFFQYLSKIKFSVKGFISVFLIYMVMNYAYLYIMENTLMGERLLSIDDDAQKFGADGNSFLSFLGDRASFYVNGFDLFLDNIWTGIGILNYQSITNSYNRIHSEYMVQLTENGLIGFILYLCFYLYFIYNLLVTKIRCTTDISNKNLMIGFIISILFISFTAWTYDMCFYFYAFGIIIGFSSINKYKKNKYEGCYLS